MSDQDVHGSREVDALLSDGRVVTVRGVRPDDHAGLLALHEELSDDNLRRRFFSTGRVQGARYVDHLCSGSDGLVAALIAVMGEQVCGLVSAERVGADVAELAVVVADGSHGLGVGTLLLEHLAAACLRQGVTRLVADVLVDNHPALEMLRDAGADLVSAPDDDVVHLEMSTVATTRAVEVADEREAAAERRSLEPVLAPRSVALVGVRSDGTGLGAAVLEAVRAGGFPGELHVVHPTAPSIAGTATVGSLTGIGHRVDLVVVTTPPGSVEAVLENAVAAGARGAVVLTAGVSGLPGASARILRLVRSHSLRLVGPNCLGILANAPEISLDATFASAVPPHGGLAIASQSGGVGIVMLDEATRAGLGIRAFVSLGDKLDVSGNDLLAAWYDDPAVTIVALYLESFGNPQRFLHLARRFSLRKPVLAVAAGRSPAGRRAGAAHTGTVGLEDAVARAIYAQAGIIICPDAESMCRTAKLLGGQPLPRGERVGIVTNTAGIGVLASDAAVDAGLDVPRLSADVRARLGREGENPVDVGAGASVDDYRAAVETLAASGEVDIVLVVAAQTRLARTPGLAALGSQVQLPAEVPLVMVRLGGGDAEPAQGRATLLPSVADAIDAIAGTARYARWLRCVGTATTPPASDVERMVAGRWVAGRMLGAGTTDNLTETTADLEGQRELLALYGLAPTSSRGSAEAVELAVELVRDPSVGSTLRVSYAGAGAELLDDRVMIVLPAARGDVAAALSRLAVWPLLVGHDGGSGFDVAALEQAVSAVGLLAAEVPQVAGVLLDPLRVFARGVVVGSATVRLATGASFEDGGLRALT